CPSLSAVATAERRVRGPTNTVAQKAGATLRGGPTSFFLGFPRRDRNTHHGEGPGNHHTGPRGPRVQGYSSPARTPRRSAAHSSAGNDKCPLSRFCVSRTSTAAGFSRTSTH